MTDANRTQADYWASAAGLKWIEHEVALDTAMAPMLDLIFRASEISASEAVIDIGCGTGASTLDAAAKVPEGRALGVDISQPLLDRARSRATSEGVGNVDFLLADAQTYVFEPERHDLLISRIGMSFFDDTLLAFRNLARAMRPGGRMVFVSWAAVSLNPWFYLPKAAAEAQLGRMPETDPNAPGPTGFQDAARVAAIMRAAGLRDVSAGPVDIVLTPPGGLLGAAAVASRVGPAARVMNAYSGTDEDAQRIEDATARAFMAFDNGPAVRVPAVVNLFTARV